MKTVRVCDVCGRRFRITSPRQLRCSSECKREGERRKAAAYNSEYRVRVGTRDRYNRRRGQWREANRERERDKHRKYAEEKRDQINEWSREYRRRRNRRAKKIDSEYLSEGTLTEYQRRYYEANRDRLREQSREYREKNKPRVAEATKRWRIENRQKINARLAQIRRQNPTIRLVVYVRNRITKALRLAETSKAASTHEYVGMSGPELMAYLLAHRNGRPGFTADNYGTVWHCDHIRPLASFDLTDHRQAKKAFHYSNLQPMEAKENLSKGAMFDGRRHRHGGVGVTTTENGRRPKRPRRRPRA
jgi:hypothetical protein